MLEFDKRGVLWVTLLLLLQHLLLGRCNIAISDNINTIFKIVELSVNVATTILMSLYPVYIKYNDNSRTRSVTRNTSKMESFSTSHLTLVIIPLNLNTNELKVLHKTLR